MQEEKDQPQEKELGSCAPEYGDLTACGKCAHFIQLPDIAGRADIWYNLRCGKRENPARFNCITGEFVEPLDLRDKYQYCRDLNINGHCPLFEEKE